MANLGANIPVQRSAQQFIQSGLRLVGSLRSGQNLSAAELTDSLQVLQDMVDAWSAERLMIYTVPYTTLDQNGVALTLSAGKQKYTLGNVNGNENLLLPRPPKIDRASIVINASASTPIEKPMEMYDDVRWQSIPNKSTQSLYPEVCYVEPTVDGTDWLLYFWPIPTQVSPVVLYPWAALNQFPNLQAKFFFPPAYIRAIRFNLAVDLAAEFPCDMQKLQLVMKIADQAKNVIKSLNLASVAMKEAVCDAAIVGASGSRGNIYSGSASRSHNN